MTDYAVSYIKSVSIPSENIKSESKKNIQLFLKKFKLHKCNLLAKLNKKQINKSHVIRYFKESIEQLNKIKKERLQKIILLTKDLFENISDDETEDILEGSDQCNEVDDTLLTRQEKQLETNFIDGKSSNNNQILNEKIFNENVSIQNEQMEIDLLSNKISRDSIADVMEIIEEDEENHKEVNLEDNIKEIEVDKFPKIYLDDIFISSSLEKEMDKTFDIKIVNGVENNKSFIQFQTDSIKSSEISNPKPINEKLSNMPEKSKLIGLNTTLKDSKAGPRPNRLLVKNSQIKTPQQPLYKTKFHPTAQGGNSMSKWKANSLVKSQTNLCSGSTSQTVSAQKKPLTEYRKPQEKIEEEKRRKLEEIKAKRKENCIKLAAINEAKKVAVNNKPKTNYSSMKPGISNHASTLAAGSSLKSNAAGHLSSLPQRPIIAINQSQKHATVIPQKKPNPIDKFPLLSIATNQMTNTLKPINADLTTRSNLTSSSNTGSQSACSILSEFKTPFSKQRLTILSDSCKKIINSHESYDISGLADFDSDEEEDEENHSKSSIPRWSRKENGTLEKLVRYQMKHYNPSDIILEACHVMIDYNEVFGENTTIEPGVLEEWL